MYNKLILTILSLLFLQTANASEGVATVEPLVIFDAWARPSMSSNNNSAVYMTIQNNSDIDYKLLSASSISVASKVELHNSFVDQKGVSRMVKIDNIVIPSKTNVMLTPGRMHIMLLGLLNRLEIGDKFKLKLVFENIEPKIVEVEVKAMTR